MPSLDFPAGTITDLFTRHRCSDLLTQIRCILEYMGPAVFACSQQQLLIHSSVNSHHIMLRTELGVLYVPGDVNCVPLPLPCRTSCVLLVIVQIGTTPLGTPVHTGLARKTVCMYP